MTSEKRQFSVSPLMKERAIEQICTSFNTCVQELCEDIDDILSEDPCLRTYSLTETERKQFGETLKSLNLYSIGNNSIALICVQQDELDCKKRGPILHRLLTILEENLTYYPQYYGLNHKILRKEKQIRYEIDLIIAWLARTTFHELKARKRSSDDCVCEKIPLSLTSSCLMKLRKEDVKDIVSYVPNHNIIFLSPNVTYKKLKNVFRFC